MKAVKNFYKRYFALDDHIVLRHKIIDYLASKIYEKLNNGLKNKTLVSENTDKKILLSELSEKLEVSIDAIMKQSSVLLHDEEIGYEENKGFTLKDKGFASVANKKHIKDAEDVLWKRRERIFNFITKPIVFVIAIATATISGYTLYKTETRSTNTHRMELKIISLQASLFQLQSEMAAIQNKPPEVRTK